MIWIRKTFGALKDGAFIESYAGENVVAYFRQNNENTVLVVVNKGNDASVKLNIPEAVMSQSRQLKCIYGGNGYFKPDRGTIEFYIGGKNAYIFAG
jgi:hypothetical protein